MISNRFRLNEVLVLLYRLFLAFFFYFIVRTLFYIYNGDLLNVDSFWQYLTLAYHGMTFDRIAIFYLSSLFILLSILPIYKTTTKGYQKLLFWTYIIPNLIGFSINFIDLIYYRFIYARTTIAVFDSLEHESNKGTLFFNFLINYWHVFLLCILCCIAWVYLYKRVKFTRPIRIEAKKPYWLTSIAIFVVVVVGFVAGVRGDLKKTTRPLNMIDANRYVTKPEHADIVLNTPFSVLRTIGKTSFKQLTVLDEATKDKYVSPVKQYTVNTPSTPNIVLFITESYGREYIGALNEDMNIEGYQSYTPFIDSLAKHSRIYPNAFANGYKSIHGMSSVVAGIPSFKDAFTSSPYPKQKIESLVSTLKSKGYDTSFFHGAPNGSMGFLGFGNILGYDHYYGKTEYNNDADFDGTWGIWDEPFFQYMKEVLSTKEGPFFATLFSVSSHEPFNIPAKYEGKFPVGTVPIHKTVGYTDYAFKRFFEESRKEPWFDNTIFIITADHTNQVAYDEYVKLVNRTAVPIIIYTADERLKGVDKRLAQQIDIYPTVLDLIGYDKPFRSWGRSLINDTITKPFVVNYVGSEYTYQEGNYICRFNGKEITGYFDINDKGLTNNLINEKNAEMQEIGLKCMAIVQDYFDRVVEKKLE
ncbi:LTA synthase family protein [Myroides pelagicus]|uniref:Sulfatase-like hydrolase/transferase n=1 Tax=Myroides pelagicus TaxID=270914 RepID=A0A7K1GI80_9FLAO|nr:alkaline phosphatase family protein [Myroides pelagicus]MEC4114130.1 sulfatase-like hydrolase/transferase [Myroides pelagicus]MTH28490.1 sulfatase-like hydrolase/transferase [Myroides pelagicus]